MGWTNRPDSLNPFIGYESSAYEIYHLNYDMLFGFNAPDVLPTPELAAELPTQENGGISADGKTVTVKLRQNLTWQDGTPLTAADVAFTFNYIVDNELSAYTMYTGYVESADVVDDYTVRFNLEKPKANFMRMWVPVLPEHLWGTIPPDAAETTFANKPPIIGSGPFQVVEENKTGDYVRMVANERYWRGAPKVDEVILKTYVNPDTMVQDLKAGAVDVIWGLPEAQFGPLSQTPGITAIAYTYNGFEDLGFNCYEGATSLGHPVLRDWQFRQALNWAIDKDKLVEVAYGGLAEPATSIIPKDYYPKELDWHWEPPAEEKYAFDLEKAKAALDAAGYADADGDGVREYKGEPIRLRLWARTESQPSQRAGRLLTNWFEEIGLSIRYTVIDDAAMSDKMYNTDAAGEFAPDYDMFLWRNGGDVDPTYILSCFLTDQINSWSDCAWSNPEFDALFLQQASQIDQQERLQTVQQMEQMIYKECPYIPLVYPQELEAYNTADWEGWVRSPATKGGVIYNYNNVDSYLFVQPKAAAAAEEGGDNTWLYIGLAVAAVVVVVVVLLVARRRGQAVEE